MKYADLTGTYGRLALPIQVGGSIEVRSVLRTRREAAGFSREALGRAVGRSTSLITAMERGYRCGDETAARIAKVLDCSTADVLHETPLERVEAGS